MEEAELIQLIQNGQKEAFEVLFETYRMQAFRTAYFITGNRSTSEDVVQEAFVQCFLHIHTLKEPAKFRSWFYRILTRLAWKASDAEKKSAPTENIFETAEQSLQEDSIQSYLKKEEHYTLWEAVNSLDQKQKTSVILYYYNDMTIHEIASAMGCLEGTVKSRLFFARQKLYKKLGGKELFSGKGCENHEKSRI